MIHPGLSRELDHEGDLVGPERTTKHSPGLNAPLDLVVAGTAEGDDVRLRAAESPRRRELVLEPPLRKKVVTSQRTGTELEGPALTQFDPAVRAARAQAHAAAPLHLQLLSTAAPEADEGLRDLDHVEVARVAPRGDEEGDLPDLATGRADVPSMPAVLGALTEVDHGDLRDRRLPVELVEAHFSTRSISAFGTQ